MGQKLVDGLRLRLDGTVALKTVRMNEKLGLTGEFPMCSSRVRIDGADGAYLVGDFLVEVT